MSEKWWEDRGPVVPASERIRSMRRRRRTRIATVAVMVAAGLVSFQATRLVLAPDGDLIEDPPPSILGTWTTDDPRYAGRAFVIQLDRFQVRTGPDQVQVSPISEIRRTATPEFDAYRIVYSTSEGEMVHDMRLYPDGVARLRNPADVVWTRR